MRRDTEDLALHFALLQVLWTHFLTDTTSLGPDSQITDIAFLQELEHLCLSTTEGELLVIQPSREIHEVTDFGDAFS